VNAAAGGGSDRPGGGVVVRPDGEQRATAPGVGAMGMAVFLASLSMLFLAGLVGFLVIRFRAESWPPPGAPGLPPTLWASSVLLVGCSLAIQRGLKRIRRGDQTGLRRAIVTTLVLALLYLTSQLVGWIRLFGSPDFTAHLWGFTFFMLTALHWVHVLGGVAAVAVVGRRAWTGQYSWAHYPGVRFCALYWHFLTVVWMVIIAALVLV